MLVAVGECCHNLRSLAVTNRECEGISDTGLVAVANGCQGLESLSVLQLLAGYTNGGSWSDAGLVAVARKVSYPPVLTCLRVSITLPLH